jgi:hypothetical protein
MLLMWLKRGKNSAPKKRMDLQHLWSFTTSSRVTLFDFKTKEKALTYANKMGIVGSHDTMQQVESVA